MEKWDDDDKDVANMALRRASIVEKLALALKRCETEATDKYFEAWEHWTAHEKTRKGNSASKTRVSLKSLEAEQDQLYREVYASIEFGHRSQGPWLVTIYMSLNSSGNPGGLIPNLGEVAEVAKGDATMLAIQDLARAQNGSYNVFTVNKEITDVTNIRVVESVAIQVFNALPVLLLSLIHI